MQKISVVGAGTMGRGISEASLLQGFSVVLLDSTMELAEKGLSALKKSFLRSVEKGRLPKEKADDCLSRISFGCDYTMVKDSSVIIEAVYENLDVKKNVLSRVSGFADDTALIASNTSSLSITQMSTAVRKPERFLGIHFFNPVPVMKLCEVIKGDKTTYDTMDKAVQFCLALGKTPVKVKESPGFIVNRLLCPMLNEAAHLVMEGVASPQDIDVAMKLGANHPIGPLSLSDLIGIDVLYAIMETLEKDLGEKYKPCPLLKNMIEEGKVGRKSGEGFFKYPS